MRSASPTRAAARDRSIARERARPAPRPGRRCRSPSGEAAEDLFHAEAHPAADLGHAGDRWRAGGVVQPADGGPEEDAAQGVVDQRELDGVELHGNLLARWLRSATPPGNACARWAARGIETEDARCRSAARD